LFVRDGTGWSRESTLPYVIRGVALSAGRTRGLTDLFDPWPHTVVFSGTDGNWAVVGDLAVGNEYALSGDGTTVVQGTILIESREAAFVYTLGP
jgi:hypothetical protein